MPAEAAGVVVDDPDRGVLLLWRHRFITDTWGWELPAGRVDAGETAIEAGASETLEETGWRPGPLVPLTSYFAHNGTSDMHVQPVPRHFGDTRRRADRPRRGRTDRVGVRGTTVRTEIRAGRIRDGLSLTGLLYRLAGM